MAVRRSYNALNQVRVSVSDMRGVESAVRADFDELLAGLVTGVSKPYIVRGFEIEMAGSIGSSATALQVIVANSSILHGSSATAGTFFNVPSGTPSQTLSSSVNPKVDGAFTPGSINYVGVDLTRQPSATTNIQRYFFSPAVKAEFVRTAPQAELLDYKFTISTTPFSNSPSILPIAIIETDGANNVLSVEDRRPLLFRLGTAGAGIPDPTNEYGWDNQAEGRVENPSVSSSSTTSPFRGGDKQIYSMKEMFDALMTELKLLKGTPFWYSESVGGSIYRLRTDLGNTIITSKGAVSHDADIAGKLTWSQDINLVVIGSRVKYKILANANSNNVILDDNEVAYLTLVRDVTITPNIVFTQGSTLASSVGSVPWTAGLVAGDYVKDASGFESKYYQIQSVDSPSQVTLADPYVESSTGIGGIKCVYSFGVYEAVPTPTTNRHVKIGNRNDIEINQDNYWLYARQDGSELGAEQTQIDTIADVGGSLNGASFRLFANDDFRKYLFVFNDGNVSVSPGEGEQLVYIPLKENLTADEVALLIEDIIDEQTDFEATSAGNSVVVTNALQGASASGEDVDTGFTFSQTFAGAKAKIYARFFGSEVEQGETRQISDNENFELINYMGARSETDSRPEYSTAFETITPLSFRLTLPPASQLNSGDSFVVFSVNDNEVYRPWFEVDGAGAPPQAPGEIPVKIPVSSSFNAAQVAESFANQFSLLPDFTTNNNGNGTVNVSLDVGGRTSVPFNVDVLGLVIDVLTYGSGEQNYYLQDGENLTKAIKRLDVSVQRIIKAISDEAYEESYRVVAGSPSSIYEIAGPILAGNQFLLPLNSVKNFAATGYKVGANQLEIFLNGLFLKKGEDWQEVGAPDEESILVETSVDLEVGDLVTYRIDTGTLGPIFAGSSGGASAIYDESVTVNATIASGTPVSLPLGKTYDGKELQVYRNGNFVEEPLDYIGVSSSEVAFNYDLIEGDVVRFRVDSGMGSGGNGGGGLQINSGEANTASNSGVSGVGLFKDKIGVDLRFKRIVAGPGVTVFDNPDSVTITAAPSAPIKNVRTLVGAGDSLTVNDDYVRVLNSGSDLTVFLPNASSAGKEITIKKIDSGNVLSVATTLNQTIDGVNATLTPLLITVQNEAVTLIANGTDWEII